MISLFNSIVNEVSKRIKEDLGFNRNMQVLLDAYNYWQENEYDGANYIFDINNKDDVKFLVNKDHITTTDIVWIVGAKENLFKFNDSGIELLSDEEAIEIIKNNLDGILQCMFLYVARCGEDSPYAKLYEYYITDKLEHEEFRQY